MPTKSRMAGVSNRPITDREFWALTETADAGCMEWKGSKTRHGYGYLKAHGKTVRAHRYAWELTYGPVPSGLYVCHRCDNPPCVNPDHLFLGTQLENMRDAARKGRLRHKLDASQVAEVLALRQDGWTQKAIAGRFGCTPTLITSILRGYGRQLATGMTPAPRIRVQKQSTEEDRREATRLREQGLTQAEVGARLGYTQAAISEWERSRATTTRSKTGRIVCRCQQCGAEFEARYVTAKYCTSLCASRAFYAANKESRHASAARYREARRRGKGAPHGR